MKIYCKKIKINHPKNFFTLQLLVPWWPLLSPTYTQSYCTIYHIKPIFVGCTTILSFGFHMRNKIILLYERRSTHLGPQASGIIFLRHIFISSGPWRTFLKQFMAIACVIPLTDSPLTHSISSPAYKKIKYE